MAESNSRLRLLVVFASAALFGCRGAGTTVTTSTNEPARAVPFSAKDLSGYSPEWIAGIAYVGRDRIDAAVTDARLSPSRTGALRVRAILVRGIRRVGRLRGRVRQSPQKDFARSPRIREIPFASRFETPLESRSLSDV
jgi:hypothetical protein